MDEMNNGEHDELIDAALIQASVVASGALPASVRARVRRRRVVHRVKTGGGAIAGLAACVLVVVVLMRPSASGPGQGVPSWNEGAVIGIDDPMFDALDGRGGSLTGGTRWRAGMRLDDEWVLDI